MVCSAICAATSPCQVRLRFTSHSPSTAWLWLAHSDLAWLAQVGALRVNTILKIALEVCRGMDYLHKRKIVHRDLKVGRWAWGG